MRVAARKIRRAPAPGELAIAQTRDAAMVARLLEGAGMTAAGVDAPGGCFLVAHLGDDPAGVIGLETKIDAALLRSLHVREPMRRRGIGAALLAAVRLAAHTRGARRLYAIVADDAAGRWFAGRGFAPEPAAAILAAMAGAPYADYLRENFTVGELCGLAVDISGDGVIER